MTAIKATPVGMKAMTEAMKAMTVAMKAMTVAIKATPVGMKATTIGGMDGRMSGITAKAHTPAGALTTSVPMAGKSAAASNSVRSGTAAHN
jgi:hypothetical protein